MLTQSSRDVNTGVVPMRRTLFGSTAITATGIAVSRIAGYAWTLLFGVLFPVETRSLFIFAFRIPSFLRGLLAEGALSSAYVPVFSEYFATREPKETRELIGVTLTATTIVLLCATAIGILVSPWLVTLSDWISILTDGKGLSAENQFVTVKLLRVMFPYILLVGLAAFATGLQYALKEFTAPAFAPVLMNLAMIATALWCRNWFREPVMALTVGVILGGLAQLILQMYCAGKLGVSFRPGLQFGHPGLRKIFSLWVPVVLGSSVLQVNLVVDSMIGLSYSGEIVSALFFASRLMQLPLALIGVAASTAFLPTMAEQVARGNIADMKKTLLQGLQMVSFLTIPAMVGLIVLSKPITSLLFERVNFTAKDTADTAFALIFYCLGLPFFSGVKMLTSAFYSRQETKLPMKVAVGAMVVNIILNLALIRPLAQGGLALATSLSFLFNFLLLFLLLRRRIGLLGGTALAHSVGKGLLASCFMGMCAWLCNHELSLILGTAHLGAKFIEVTVSILVGVGVFVVCCWVLRMEEMSTAFDLVKRRLTGAGK